MSITYAYKIMNSLLMEADLKENFKNIQQGSAITIILDNEDEDKIEFIVTKVEGGEVEMVLPKSAGKYIFSSNALKNGIFSMNEFDKSKGNGKGKEIKYDIKSFIISKGGKFDEVEIDSEIDNTENLTKEMNEMNAELSKLKPKDILNILSVEVDSDKGDEFSNNIFLKVGKISKSRQFMECYLYDLESSNTDYSNSSKWLGNLSKIFSNNKILVNFKDMISIVNDDLVLSLYSKKNKNRAVIKIPGISNVTIIDSNDDSDDNEVMSKEELLNRINNSPNSEEYKNAIYKNPSFFEVLSNATPLGVKKLDNKLKKYINKNSYLTKGNKVKINILSKNIVINHQVKLLQKNKNLDNSYFGTVESDRKIKINRRNDVNGYWIIEVKKELKNGTYLAKVVYCTNKNVCKAIDNKVNISINNV